MNLFLLAAVPLAAVVLHHLFFSSRSWRDPGLWIGGAVWSVLSLVAVTPFGKAREFSGDVWAALGGLVWTDVLLVPAGVAAAWVLTRPRRDAWELGLWLSLVFTMAGVRDFVSTSRLYDLTELFLVPLDRILLIVLLPAVLPRALSAATVQARVLFWSLAGALGLSGAVFPALSFAGWGWLVWLLEGAGLAAGVFLWHRTTAAARPAQP